jgi:hypothetical protein
MLLEEDVAMNVEDIRVPPRPPREVPPPQPREPEPDHECQTENETPWVPLSPPPAPWPRVFPGL